MQAATPSAADFVASSSSSLTQEQRLAALEVEAHIPAGRLLIRQGLGLGLGRPPPYQARVRVRVRQVASSSGKV
jgi:hypothetical protein